MILFLQKVEKDCVCFFFDFKRLVFFFPKTFVTVQLVFMRLSGEHTKENKKLLERDESILCLVHNIEHLSEERRRESVTREDSLQITKTDSLFPPTY